MTDVPLLRAPPFPGRPVIVARPASGTGQLPERILDAICSARVGGAYWAAPAALGRMPDVVLRPRTDAEIEALAADYGGEGTLWVAVRASGGAARRIAVRQGGQWCNDVDPWSVLEGGSLLVAHGDDEWVAIAAIIGARVKLLSDGQHGRCGEDSAALAGRVRAGLAAMEYLDPFDGKAVTIDAVIDQICVEVDRAFDEIGDLAARFAEAPAAKGQPTAILKTYVEDRKGHDRRYAIDETKARRELGYAPQHAFDEGLRGTLRWYLENETWWRPLQAR